MRRDAEAFGKDLKTLRGEKERAEGRLKEEVVKGERARKQGAAQVRLLNEQLEKQKEKTGRAKEELRKHVCAAYVSLLFFAPVLEAIVFTDLYI